jgi:hypothetical protein
MKKIILLIAACTAIIFTVNAQNPDIQGTWRGVSLDGKQIPKEYSVIKIFNSTHSAIIMSDAGNNIIAAVTGTYTFDGDTLIENYAVSIGADRSARGKRIISKLTFEGNRMNQLGGIEGGKPDTEDHTWERVE